MTKSQNDLAALRSANEFLATGLHDALRENRILAAENADLKEKVKELSYQINGSPL
jgi:hypothetical protein